MSHFSNRTFVVVLLIALAISQGVLGRMGCAFYGHSCYGGLGKRSNLEEAKLDGLQSNNELFPDSPTYGFKGSVNYQADQPSIPSRALRLLNDSPEQYSKINKYVKEWIIDYLKNEETEVK